MVPIIVRKWLNGTDTNYEHYCTLHIPVHIFESAWEARRLLAIICIRFLANRRLCKHLQNQLVRTCLPMFIYIFSNSFPLHLIHSSMVWYFPKNSESLINEVIHSKANKWGAVRIWIYLKAHEHAFTDYFLKV